MAARSRMRMHGRRQRGQIKMKQQGFGLPEKKSCKLQGGRFVDKEFLPCARIVKRRVTTRDNKVGKKVKGRVSREEGDRMVSERSSGPSGEQNGPTAQDR